MRRFLLAYLIVTGVMCGLAAMLFHQLVEIAHRMLIGRALSQHEPLRFMQRSRSSSCAGRRPARGCSRCRSGRCAG